MRTMASRLQFQQTETGSATPTQQSAPLQPENIFTPPIQTTPAPLHQIEPELVGTRSRYVQSKVSDTGLVYCGIQLIVILAISYYVTSKYTDKLHESLVIGTLVFLFLSGGAWYVIWDHRRTAELLRNGKAVSATVISFRNSTHFMLVQVAYISNIGELVETCVKIHPEIVKSERLYPGNSFTLLVSPENPEHAIPYLLTTNTFSVSPVEPTKISENVSARVAEQIANAPVQFVGHLGAIEPELIGTKTREITFTKKHKDKVFWSTFLLPLLISIVLIVFTKIPVYKYSNWVYYYVLFCICMYLRNLPSNPFTLHFQSTSLLKDGIATRAIIVDEYVAPSSATTHEKRTASYVYEYITFTGEKVSDSFVFPVKRAWQLGLSKGATFTVLYNIRNASDHKPYFQITDAEIVGAMGAKITPP